MALSDHTLLIEVRNGAIQIDSKVAEPLKVTLKEKPCEDNNYELGNESTLRLDTDEVNEFIRALQYLKD